MKISKTGLWVDNDGGLVDKAPERGTQLVAPGQPITPFAERLIARHEARQTTAPQVAEAVDEPRGDGIDVPVGEVGELVVEPAAKKSNAKKSNAKKGRG